MDFLERGFPGTCFFGSVDFCVDFSVDFGIVDFCVDSNMDFGSVDFNADFDVDFNVDFLWICLEVLYCKGG